MIYYTWTYNNTLYVPEVPRWERWQTMSVPFELAWKYHPLLPVIGVLGAGLLLRRALLDAFRSPRQFDLPYWLILGWCAAGLISTTLSGRGFSHYSIQLIPGLSLACGWVTVRLITIVHHWIGSNKTRIFAGITASIILLIWLLLPLGIRLQSLQLPEPGTDVISGLVRRLSDPADRIFVWGYNPDVYAISGRMPATRFLYCTFLTGLIPWTNLDPLKNTEYAVVPGAWDKFLADWNRHPPILIADGRSQRGFLKYPIDEQPLLWPLIARNYAQVEIDTANQIGFWLFRRLETITPTSLPALDTSDKIQLQIAPTEVGSMARAFVQAPAGTRLVELFLDGRLYLRLRCAPEAPVSACFFILPHDRSPDINHIQALAQSGYGHQISAEQTLGSAKPPRFLAARRYCSRAKT
ncbi:MAG: hypothetical protein K9M98_03735 [Cephaloticoccus sp.]|nr:hypothetical protein [Cephaloticoccus sp.]MCF7759593.1 hypothetical protein [Cephaloticoccus sp.]